MGGWGIITLFGTLIWFNLPQVYLNRIIDDITDNMTVINDENLRTLVKPSVTKVPLALRFLLLVFSDTSNKFYVI